MSVSWPSLLDAAVALVIAAGSYFFGKRQGRIQVLHQEGVKAAVEVGRKVNSLRRWIERIRSRGRAGATGSVSSPTRT